MSDYLALYRQYLQSINPALDGEFLIAEIYLLIGMNQKQL